VNISHSFCELKGAVRREIVNISRQELRYVSRNIFGMCEASLEAVG
jgi:hypothetical protein